MANALSYLSLPDGWQAALVCKAYRTCWQRRYLGEEELCVVKVGMTMELVLEALHETEDDVKVTWKWQPAAG